MAAGDAVRGLRIASRWDPTKYVDGSEIPNLSQFNKEPPVVGMGTPGLGKMPASPAPDDGTYDQSVMSEKETWAHTTDTSNKRDGYGGSDPFPGIPM